MDKAAREVPEELARQRTREAEFKRKLAAAGGTREAENRLLQENKERAEAERKARLKAYNQQRKRKAPAA